MGMRSLRAALLASSLASTSSSILELNGETPHIQFRGDDDTVCTITYTGYKLVSDCPLNLPPSPPPFSGVHRVATHLGEHLSNVYGGGNMIDAPVDGSFVYSVGSTMGAIGTRQGTYPGYQGYLMKHDSTGATSWVRQIGHEPSFHMAAVTAAPGGSAYAVAKLKGTLLGLDNPPVHDASNHSDIALMKFDGDGNEVWSTSCCGPALWEEPFAVRTDYDGNIFVVATTRSAPAVSHDSADLLVLKYDSSGNEIWRKTIVSDGWDQPYGMVYDGFHDAVVIAGTTHGSFDGNPHSRCLSVEGCTKADRILVKFASSDGAKLWSRQWGDGSVAESENVNGVGTDQQGNIYVTGTDFKPYSSIGKTRGYLTKFDYTGVKGYTTYIGSSDGSDGSIKVHSASLRDDSIYVAGNNKGGAFSGFTNTGTSSTNDLWVAKMLLSDGSITWVQQIGGEQAHAYTREDHSPFGLCAVADGVLVQAMTSSLIFGNTQRRGATDIVLFKYSQDGVFAA